jgi:hypothetical protein
LPGNERSLHAISSINSRAPTTASTQSNLQLRSQCPRLELSSVVVVFGICSVEPPPTRRDYRYSLQARPQATTLFDLVGDFFFLVVPQTHTRQHAPSLGLRPNPRSDRILVTEYNRHDCEPLPNARMPPAASPAPPRQTPAPVEPRGALMVALSLRAKCEIIPKAALSQHQRDAAAFAAACAARPPSHDV